MNQNEQEKTNQAVGKQTIRFACPPAILSRASIVGDMEGQGPLASYFDQIEPDPAFGMDSWEEGESEMVRRAVQTAITKSGIAKENIRYIFGGDLLGQLIGSTFGLKDFQIPIFGLYGACSTCGEALSLAAMTVNAGYASHVIAVTSSHFGGAEKQFRFPLEYGNQRPLSSTWTVTGSGAFLVSATSPDQPMKEYPRITSVTTGKIVDYGVRDNMNMGACMAHGLRRLYLRQRGTGYPQWRQWLRLCGCHTCRLYSASIRIKRMETRVIRPYRSIAFYSQLQRGTDDPRRRARRCH